MRIAFLTGSLEPGRNGVGDYTLALAGELNTRGHMVCLVALNDPWLVESSPLSGDVNGCQALRLPRSLSWGERIQAAIKFFEKNKPEWVSLQFVPYAYNPKGIVMGLGHNLSSLTAERRMHLMFHELWLGASTEYGIKDRLIGLLQRNCILRMVKKLSPSTIHTSNPSYRELLSRSGIDSNILPLFGNIPVSVCNEPEVLYTELRKHGLEINLENRGHYWLLGCFGTMHPEWDPDKLLALLLPVARARGKKIVLINAGRLGRAGESVWGQVAGRFSGEISLVSLGEQPSFMISQYLRNLDLGVATTPWAIIGKSGAVAAMLDHGIPVIVTRDDWKLRSGDTPSPAPHPLIHYLDNDFGKKFNDGLERMKPKARCVEIASSFLRDIGV